MICILPLIFGPWVIIADFNLVRSAVKKSNRTINQSLVNAFNDSIKQLALPEIPLLGRSFTWSNGQQDPNTTTIFLTEVGKMP
jgi:hypothetical protein